MRKLTIILYVLSICHWAGAQQVYTYLLTDGWHAAKAFDYGNDTCLIVGLVSDTGIYNRHHFHFTTITAENVVLQIDTYKLSDSNYVSYQSPFGVIDINNRVNISGLVVERDGNAQGMSYEFDKDLELLNSRKTIRGYKSFHTITIESFKNTYIFGGYGDSTGNNLSSTFFKVIHIDSSSALIKEFHAGTILSEYGPSHMNALQMLESENGFLLVNKIKPLNHPYLSIHQGLVIKVDSLGREQWRLPIWEDSTSVHNLVVAPLANGNYLAAYQDLYYQPDKPPGNTNKFYTASNQKSVAWFVEFDEDGQILRKWNIRKELENKRGVQDRYWTSFSHFLVEQDGSILLVGSSRDNGKYGYDVGFLLKLDGNGKYQWYRQYEISINKPYTVGKENIFCYGVTKLAKGGYALAGEYRSDPSDSFPTGTQRGLVLFVDSFGCLEPGCEVNDKIGIDEVQAKQEYFTVYPNPSNGNVQITSSNNQKPDKIAVFDMQGRVVHFTINDPFTAHSSTLHCPAGVYYLKIYRTDGYYETHKIIIQ